MIVQLIIGGLSVISLALLREYAQKNNIVLTWWQWLLTILGVIYSVFVLELIAGFLGEGATQAALVIGLITGITAVVWGVLLSRFIFRKA